MIKQKACHDELGQAREKHRGNCGEGNTDNHDSFDDDYCKDILKKMESDLLAVLHDVTSTQELDQRRGHLTKSFGAALTQLVPRRQEVQANPSSAISPPTPVQAPRTPEPEPVVEQKPDADAASVTKGWTDR